MAPALLAHARSAIVARVLRTVLGSRLLLPVVTVATAVLLLVLNAILAARAVLTATLLRPRRTTPPLQRPVSKIPAVSAFVPRSGEVPSQQPQQQQPFSPPPAGSRRHGSKKNSSLYRTNSDGKQQRRSSVAAAVTTLTAARTFANGSGKTTQHDDSAIADADSSNPARTWTPPLPSPHATSTGDLDPFLMGATSSNDGVGLPPLPPPPPLLGGGPARKYKRRRPLLGDLPGSFSAGSLSSLASGNGGISGSPSISDFRSAVTNGLGTPTPTTPSLVSGGGTSSHGGRSIASSATAALPDVAPLAVVRTPASAFAAALGPGEWEWPERFLTLANGLRVHYVDIPGRVTAATPSPGSTATAQTPLVTVVLVHGALGWSWNWRKLIPICVDHGWRVVAFDFPGHGKSDKPTLPENMTLGLYVATLVQIMTAVVVPTSLSNGNNGSLSPILASGPPSPTHPFHPLPATPGAPPPPKPTVAVLAQGFATTPLLLAMHASSTVSSIISHVVLVNAYSPPHTDVHPSASHSAWMPVLARVAAATASSLAALGLGRAVPAVGSIAAALGGSGSLPGTTTSGQSGWDAPYAPLRVPLAPLALARAVPVPWVSEIPVERAAALLGAPPIPLPTSLSSASSLHFMDATTTLGDPLDWVSAALDGRAPVADGDGKAWLQALDAHAAHAVGGGLGADPPISSWPSARARLLAAVQWAVRATDRASAVDIEAAKVHFARWASLRSSDPARTPPVLLGALSSSSSTKAKAAAVLVVWGARDPVWTRALAEWWADLGDTDHVVEIEGAGHWPAEEAAVRLADVVREFLV